MLAPDFDASHGLATRLLSAPVLIPSFLIAVYLVYRRGLPRPLPDIPYNEGIGWFGDLPSMASHIKKNNAVWTWLSSQNEKHRAALTQVFISPFENKPTLIVTDPRESQDILLRRHDEFDRSPFVSDFIRGLLPKGQVTLPTGDEWRAHRNLARDLMTPAFLHDVSAPAIYERAIDLTRLWQKKAELAAGAPFAANMDIHFCALDAIFDAAFGTEDGVETLRARLDHIENLKTSAKQIKSDGSVEFAEPPLTDVVQAFVDMDESTEIAAHSLSPAIAWKVIAWLPWFSRAWKVKEKLFERLIEKSRDRIERKKTKEQNVRCALDHLVLRELGMASKAGRQAQFHTRSFYDELFGYVLGGHDTTSTTTQWAVKFLSENQAAQAKFREALYSSIATAKSERRQPTVREIIGAKNPYIDAMLEELIRHSITLPGTARVALRDTVILGHPVPKGTEVWTLSIGPAFYTPGFPVKEEVRSQSSRDAYLDGKAPGSWEGPDMAAFKPERWLVQQDGEVSFNKNAGLHLTFGLGARGCFGRRLAELEFRIFMVLLVWNFRFEPVEGELASGEYSDKMTRVPKKVYVRLTQISD